MDTSKLETNTQTIERLTTLLTQAHKERNEAVAACAAMRQSVSDFVWNVEHSNVAGWGDVAKHTVADNSFQEIKSSLSTNCGKAFLDRMKELESKVAVREWCLHMLVGIIERNVQSLGEFGWVGEAKKLIGPNPLPPTHRKKTR